LAARKVALAPMRRLMPCSNAAPSDHLVGAVEQQWKLWLYPEGPLLAHVLRPSGLPSIADVLPRRDEHRVGARNRHYAPRVLSLLSARRQAVTGAARGVDHPSECRQQTRLYFNRYISYRRPNPTRLRAAFLCKTDTCDRLSIPFSWADCGCISWMQKMWFACSARR